MRFVVLKRDAEIERLEAVLAGADPQAAAKLRDRRWAQLDDDFAFVAKCNDGGESMEDVQLARLKTIAERGWLRTIDDTLGIAHGERQRRTAQPVPGLQVWEPLLADRPPPIIPRPPRAVLAADYPRGFQPHQPHHLYNRDGLQQLSRS